MKNFQILVFFFLATISFAPAMGVGMGICGEHRLCKNKVLQQAQFKLVASTECLYTAKPTEEELKPVVSKKKTLALQKPMTQKPMTQKPKTNEEIISFWTKRQEKIDVKKESERVKEEKQRVKEEKQRVREERRMVRRETEAKVAAEQSQKRIELEQEIIQASHLLSDAIKSMDVEKAEAPLKFLTQQGRININNSLLVWSRNVFVIWPILQDYIDPSNKDSIAADSLLHSAVRRKDFKFIDFLRKLGADINWVNTYNDEKSHCPWYHQVYGSSPLAIAKEIDDLSLIESLTREIRL